MASNAGGRRVESSCKNKTRLPFRPHARIPFKCGNLTEIDPTMNISLPHTSNSWSTSNSPVHVGKTIKEYDKEIDELRKENFNLKIRIYLIEKNLSATLDPNARQDLNLNVKLEMETENLRNQLAHKEKMCEEIVKLARSYEIKYQKAEEKIREAEDKIKELQVKLISVKEDEQDTISSNGSEVGSEIIKEAFGIDRSLSEQTLSDNERFNQIKQKRENDMQEMKNALIIKDKEIQEAYAKIKTLQKENMDLIEDKERKHTATQDIMQKLRVHNDEDKEMWHVLQKGLEAAKDNNTDGVISAVDEIKTIFSKKLAVPCDKLFGESHLSDDSILQEQLKEKDASNKEYEAKIAELQKENAILNEKRMKKAIAIKSLLQKLNNQTQFPEIFSVLQNGIEAAKNKDTSEVIAVMAEIKNFFSEILSEPVNALSDSFSSNRSSKQNVKENEIIMSMEKQIMELKEKCVDLEERYEKLKKVSKDQESSLHEKDLTLQIYIQRFENISGECKIKNEKISELQNTMKLIKDNCNQAVLMKLQEIENFKTQCAELEREATVLRKQLSETSISMNNAKTKVKELSSKLVLTLTGDKHFEKPETFSLKRSKSFPCLSHVDFVAGLKKIILDLSSKVVQKESEIELLEKRLIDLNLQIQKSADEKNRYVEQFHILRQHLEKLAEFMAQLINNTSENFSVDGSFGGSDILDQVSKVINDSLLNLGIEDSKISHRRELSSLPNNMSSVDIGRTSYPPCHEDFESFVEINEQNSTGRSYPYAFSSSHLEGLNNTGNTWKHPYSHYQLNSNSKIVDLESIKFSDSSEQYCKNPQIKEISIHENICFPQNTNCYLDLCRVSSNYNESNKCVLEESDKSRISGLCQKLSSANAGISDVGCIKDNNASRLFPSHFLRMEAVVQHSHFISSDSDVWSEPDREVSSQRIGIEIKTPVNSPSRKRYLGKDRQGSRYSHTKSSLASHASPSSSPQRKQKIDHGQCRKSLETEHFKLNLLLDKFSSLEEQIRTLAGCQESEKVGTLHNISSEVAALKSAVFEIIQNIKDLKDIIKDSSLMSQDTSILHNLKENMENILNVIGDEYQESIDAQTRDLVNEILSKVLLQLGEVSVEKPGKPYESVNENECQMLHINKDNLVQENSQLKENIKKLEKTNKCLQDDLCQVQAALNGLQERFKSMSREKNALYHEKAALAEENTDFKDRLARDEEQIRNLLAKKKELTQRLYEIQLENQNLRETIDQLEHNKMKLDKEIQALKTEKLSSDSLCEKLQSDLRETKQKLEQLSEKCLSYEKDINAVRDENSKIALEKQVLEDKIKAQTEKVSQLTEHCSKTKLILDEKDILYKDSENERQSLQRRIENLQAKGDELQTFYESSRSEKDLLAREINTLRQLYQEKDSSLNELKNEMNMLKLNVSSVKSDLDAKELLLEELLEQKNALQVEVTCANVINTEKDMQMKELQHSLAVANREILNNQTTVLDFQNEIKSLQSNFEKTCLSLSSSANENKNLQDKILDLEKLLADKDMLFKKTETEYEPLKLQLLSLQESVTGKSSAMQNLIDEIETLKKVIEVHEKENKSLQSQVVDLEKHLEEKDALLKQAMSEQETQKSQLLSMQKFIADKDSSVLNLSHDKETLKETVEAREKENKSLQDKIDALEECVNDKDTLLKKARAEQDTLKSQFLSAKESIANKDLIIQNSSSEVKTLKNEIEAYERELSRKEEYLKKIEHDFDKATVEILAKENEITKLQLKMKCLTNEFVEMQKHYETAVSKIDTLHTNANYFDYEAQCDISSADGLIPHEKQIPVEESNNITPENRSDGIDNQNLVSSLKHQLLEQEINSEKMQEQIQALKTCIVQYENQTQTLKSILEKCNLQISSYKDTIENLERKLKSSEELNEKDKSVVTGHLKNLQEKQNMIKLLKEQNSEFEEKIQKLQSKLNEVELTKESKSSAATFTFQSSSQPEEIASTNRRCYSLTSRDAVSVSSDLKESQIQKSQQDLPCVLQPNNELEDNLRKVRALHKKNLELERELKKLQSNLHETKQSSVVELQSLKDKVLKKDEFISKLKSAIEDYEYKCSDFRDNVAKLQQQIQVLENERGVSEFSSQLGKDAIIKNLEASGQKLKQTIQDLQKKIEDIKTSNVNEQKVLRKATSEQESQIKELKLEASDNKKKFVAAQNAIMELKEYIKQIKTVERKMGAFLIPQLHADANNKDHTIKNLEFNNAELRKKLDELQELFTNSSQRNDNAKLLKEMHVQTSCCHKCHVCSAGKSLNHANEEPINIQEQKQQEETESYQAQAIKLLGSRVLELQNDILEKDALISRLEKEVSAYKLTQFEAEKNLNFLNAAIHDAEQQLFKKEQIILQLNQHLKECKNEAVKDANAFELQKSYNENTDALASSVSKNMLQEKIIIDDELSKLLSDEKSVLQKQGSFSLQTSDLFLIKRIIQERNYLKSRTFDLKSCLEEKINTLNTVFEELSKYQNLLFEVQNRNEALSSEILNLKNQLQLLTVSNRIEQSKAEPLSVEGIPLSSKCDKCIQVDIGKFSESASADLKYIFSSLDNIDQASTQNACKNKQANKISSERHIAEKEQKTTSKFVPVSTKSVAYLIENLDNNPNNEAKLFENLTSLKWNLQKSILKLHRKLFQSNPDYLKNHLNFVKRIVSIHDREISRPLFKYHSEPMLHSYTDKNTAQVNAPELSIKNLLFSLQIDIEILQNIKILLKYYVTPLTQQMESSNRNEDVAMNMKNDEKLSLSDINSDIIEPPYQNKREQEEAGVFCDLPEHTEVQNSNESKNDNSRMQQLASEVRILRDEIMHLKEENIDLKKKNASKSSVTKLLEAVSSDQESAVSMDESATLSRSESISSISTVSCTEGHKIFESYKKGASKFASRLAHLSLTDVEATKDKPTCNIKNTFHDIEFQRSHYSSPDLGIESDPNHDTVPPEHIGEEIIFYRRKQEIDITHEIPVKLSSDAVLTCKRPVHTYKRDYIFESVQSFSNNETLRVTGHLQDYELLKKELEESIVGIKGISTRASDYLQRAPKNTTPKKSFEGSTLRAILDSCNNIEVCLEKAQRVVCSFSVSTLPITWEHEDLKKMLHQNEELKDKLIKITEKMQDREKEFNMALERLEHEKAKKEMLERKIAKQLVKTKKIIRKAKASLKETEEEEQTDGVAQKDEQS